MSSVMEALKDIPDFVVSVLLCVAGYLTGGVLMAIAWLWEHKHGRSISWRVCKIGVGGFLLAAFFWVWHEKNLALKAELVKNYPQLKLDVYETGLSPWYEDPKYIGAYVIGAIRNAGMQSVVTDYRFSLEHSGKTYPGMVTTFNVPFTLTDFNGRCNGSLNPLDFLPQKTATVPIAPGGRSVGWIAAKFPTAPTSIIGSDLTIVLVIQDVTGKEYTIRRSGMSGAVTGAIGDHFYSGMMQPLDKPTCAP